MGAGAGAGIAEVVTLTYVVVVVVSHVCAYMCACERVSVRLVLLILKI